MSFALAQACGVAAAMTTDVPARSYFPQRPPGVAVTQMSGRLIGYGVGNKSGGVTLQLDDGKVVNFFLAFPNRIDGKHYDCDTPPIDGKPRTPSSCRQWPQSVVVGHTFVRVTYWWANARGTRVRVSDSIASAPGR